jgi:hypothetical protein
VVTPSTYSTLGGWLPLQTDSKSITEREIFTRVPSVKEQLWGGEFWSKGYSISTVGRYGSEEILRQYVQNGDKIIKLCINSSLNFFLVVTDHSIFRSSLRWISFD